MSYFPAWLSSGIVEDTLPWDRGVTLELPEFLKRFTLHDSYYIGLFYNLAYSDSCLLAFQWDPVWLPDGLAPATGLVEDWPFLFIHLHKVQQCRTFDYEDYVDINRAIETADFKETNGEKQLFIGDAFGGKLQLSFTGDARFLALDKNGKALKLDETTHEGVGHSHDSQ